MGKEAILWRLPVAARLICVNAAIFAILFAAIELALHIKSPEQNPFLGPPFVTSKARIADPNYSHTLAANFDGDDWWGYKHYKLRTNSLGFKDSLVRNVPLRSDRKRVLFIGDSFTEGIGLPYEETFVGRFAAAFPQLDVLNAGVSSYAPSAYFAKIKYFLESGLRLDEVIVYIDISDIQDEAVFYRFGSDGRLQHGAFDSDCASPEATIKVASPWWVRQSYVLDYLDKERIIRTMSMNALRASVADIKQPGLPYERDMWRSSWTYNAASKCYGLLGIEGGITKALEQMDGLHALLAQHGVPLSVGVYPWPQQLLYDGENSRQAVIWREWCLNRCRRFFDHFPAFFTYKRDHEDFLRDLFIWADVHFNAFGNELLAKELISKYP